MRNTKQNPYWLVCASILAGALLTIFPLPAWAIWWRPQWLLMIVLFWVITFPDRYGVGVAWVAGIVMDIMIGTPLGLHALVYVVVTYVALKFHQLLLHSPRFQQALLVGFFAGMGVLLQGIVSHFLGQSVHVWHQELSAITTVLFWPLLSFLLEKSRPHEYGLV